MLRIGHMGLTVGLSSAGVAIWIRKRVGEYVQQTEIADSLVQRIRNRGKFALAGLAFSGCATVVSGTIDGVEQLLDFGHRTVAHAPPLLGGVYLAARLAKRAGFEAVRWAGERVGYDEDLDPVVEELEDLSTWVLNGGLVGAVTHVLGDLPTMGTGGNRSSLALPSFEESLQSRPDICRERVVEHCRAENGRDSRRSLMDGRWCSHLRTGVTRENAQKITPSGCR